MKRVLFAITAAVSASGLAHAAAAFEVGCSDTKKHFAVTFSSTTVNGLPSMKVSKGGEDLTSPDKSDAVITDEQTVLGKLTSVNVTPKNSNDIPAEIYSIFIPNNIGAMPENAAFRSQLILGKSGGRAVASKIISAVAISCTVFSITP